MSAAPPSAGRVGSAAVVALPCFVAGPRSRSSGRGYEINYLSDASAIDPTGISLLNDVVLALAGWATAMEEAFAIFYPLDTGTGSYMLCKGRYLGRGERGTVAVAHGVLLSAQDLAAIRRRPHRLLPLIPDPGDEPWRPERLVVTEAALARPAPGDASFEPFGDFLARNRDPVRLAVDPPATAVATIAPLLDAVPTHIVEHPITWCTTAALPTSGAFAPAMCDLTLGASGAIDRPTHRLGASGISGPIDAAPPVWRIWRSLFDTPAAEPPTPLPPAAEALLSNALFSDAYAALPPRAAIARTLGALVTPSLRLGDLWAVLARLAERAAALPSSAERDEAAAGIVDAFDAVVARADAQRAAPLFRQLLMRVPLRGGGGALREVAARRGIVGDIGEGVGALIATDMDERFLQALLGSLSSRRVASVGLSAVAEATAGLAQAQPVHYLALAPAVIDAAAAPEYEAAPDARRSAFALSRHLFASERSTIPGWLDAAIGSARGTARLALDEAYATASLVDGCIAALRKQGERPAGAGERAPTDPLWATAALAHALIEVHRGMESVGGDG